MIGKEGSVVSFIATKNVRRMLKSSSVGYQFTLRRIGRRNRFFVTVRSRAGEMVVWTRIELALREHGWAPRAVDIGTTRRGNVALWFRLDPLPERRKA